MKYSIPKNKLEKLVKIINRYSKKSNVFSMTIGNEVIEDGILTVIDYQQGEDKKVAREFPIKVSCVEVEVSGSYKIDGWSFVGTVEFTENGNIIRLADNSFEGKVPEKYNHTPKICEHCGKIRNRKDTYLIYNNETGEFKQVGSSCLLEYTRGLDADVCASIMSCLNKVEDLTKLEYAYDEFISFDSCAYCDNLTVKKLAVKLVKDMGYTKGNGGTVDVLIEHLLNGPTKVDDSIIADVEKIDAYVETITDTYGYKYNAKLAWEKENVEYRDFALICSLVSVFFKEQLKLIRETQMRETTHYVGDLGSRISFNVKSSRALYEKAPVCYGAPCATVYEIIDTDGNTFIWSTTNMIQDNDKITATVKDHKEYKGVKQTVVTRGKITR